MAERTPTDGHPYYCATCGAGLAERMACEEPDCEAESAEESQRRAPRRIQRRRTKGWQMPVGAIYVGRPTEWGSPFPVERCFCPVRPTPGSDEWAVGTFDSPGMWFTSTKRKAAEISVEAYGHWVQQPSNRKFRDRATLALRGHDLACWCKLCTEHVNGKSLGVQCDACEPCHADVLLEIANA